MAGIGPPEVDLGWWIFFDKFLSDGMWLPRLDGIPGPEETVAHYEQLTGSTVRDLEYWELLAEVRMNIIVLRGQDLRAKLFGQPADPISSTLGTPVARMLAAHLGEPFPELNPTFAQMAERRGVDR
jgi:aminoglycoside phosphotransferase (APT) family kinase protein